MNVLFEAIFVGLFLLPIYFVAEKLASGYGKMTVVFLSGALFHIVAEILGINKYYVQMKK
jgi:hypothetical protein